MEGVTLRDQFSFLLSAGVDEDAQLMKVNAALTERQFEEKVANGAPIDMTLQKWLYQQLDGTKTIFQVASLHQLDKARWVPTLFNLISCDLIAINGQTRKVEAQTSEENFSVDMQAVDKAGSDLARLESGFLSYPLFLYFLKLECARSLRTRSPLSLIVFEINHQNEGTLTPLSNSELRELATRIGEIKECYDMLGHCQTVDFALLAPTKDKQSATLLANEILNVASNSPLDPQSNLGPLLMACGIAGIPEDGVDLQTVLTAALDAKARARKRSRAST
jgi:GGDEF domain-containing protein